MVKAVRGLLFLSLLLAAGSGAMADVIQVETCTGTGTFGSACIPTGSTLVYLDGSTSSTAFTYGGIAATLATGASATDSFSWSSGPFSLTGGTVNANSSLTGSGLSASLLEGLSFGVTATDSTGVVGVIELTIQQNISTPLVESGPTITGSSSLVGSCSSNSAGSISANAQSGGYFIGQFNSVPCSTTGFNVPGSGVIPYYAADGDFYEQAFFTFNADGSVSESMTLPLGGSVPVPDPQVVTATPEPPSWVLLGAGLLGLAGLRFRRRLSWGIRP